MCGWDWLTREIEGAYECTAGTGVGLWNTDLVASADGNFDGARMATVGLDGFARVWDLETLALLHEIEVGGLGTAVAFAGNDQHLIVVTRAGGVRVFHLELDSVLDVARERLRRGFTEDECRVYFPDGNCPNIEDILAG